MIRIFTLIALLLISTACSDEQQARVLLFDQGHGQAFTIEDEGPLQLGEFATLLKKPGVTIRAIESELTPEALDSIDALIISGPFRAYSATEVTTVRGFIERGGRVAIMLHIAQPMWSLLDELGVDVANGVLREQVGILDENPINFSVTDLAAHPILQNLTAIKLYGGWPLRPAGDKTRIIAHTGTSAWVDLNANQLLDKEDAVQSFGVIVTGTIGQGEFVVFADDAIFQNRFLDQDNRKLAENLGRWLARR